jgi:hypothetical protein
VRPTSVCACAAIQAIPTWQVSVYFFSGYFIEIQIDRNILKDEYMLAKGYCTVKTSLDKRELYMQNLNCMMNFFVWLAAIALILEPAERRAEAETLVLGWDVDKKLRNGVFLASNGLKLKSNRSKSLLSDGLRRPVSSVRHEHAQHRADSHIRREHQGQEIPDQNLGVPFTAGKPHYNVSSPYYSARKISFGLRTPGFLCMTQCSRFFTF